MIIDNHVHMGWYSDGYHSPMEVWVALKSAGIDQVAISSTSTCAELYHNVLTEFCQFISLMGNVKTSPILWLTPRMFQKKWPLKALLKSKIQWKGIKLHYISHPQWNYSRYLLKEAIDVARLLGNVPVLFHTGEWPCCHALKFYDIIESNQDLKFVLAHGRPINETISLMKTFPNIWTDTAFMPVESLHILKEDNLSNKVLFGTDAPINKFYYPNMPTFEYLLKRIREIKKIDSLILQNTIY